MEQTIRLVALCLQHLPLWLCIRMLVLQEAIREEFPRPPIHTLKLLLRGLRRILPLSPHRSN